MAENSLQISDRQSAVARQSLEPSTLAEAIEFSKMIAESNMVPKDYIGKPANILVAIQFGKELNVAPLQALQGIAVISGRPVVWGDLMWALVTSHPQFEDAIEEITDTSAKVTLKRRGRTPVTVTFTKEDAIKAKLWDKDGPWKQYPKRQMQWRARTFAARDLFPDALKGLTSAEEAMDYPGQTIDATPATTATVTATTQATEEPTVGTEGGTAFFKAYKAHGWTTDDAKKWLADNLQIGAPHNDKDSRAIPKSKFTQAMEWANSKSPLYVEATALFDTLGFTGEEGLAFVNQHKSDYVKIVAELKAELERRNAQEQ